MRYIVTVAIVSPLKIYIIHPGVPVEDLTPVLIIMASISLKVTTSPWGMFLIKLSLIIKTIMILIVGPTPSCSLIVSIVMTFVYITGVSVLRGRCRSVRCPISANVTTFGFTDRLCFTMRISELRYLEWVAGWSSLNSWSISLASFGLVTTKADFISPGKCLAIHENRSL